MRKPIMRRGNIYVFMRSRNEIPTGTRVVAVKPVPNSDDLWYVRTIPKDGGVDRTFWCNTEDLAMVEDKHCVLAFCMG